MLAVNNPRRECLTLPRTWVTSDALKEESNVWQAADREPIYGNEPPSPPPR
jgi:hypothetical protein